MADSSSLTHLAAYISQYYTVSYWHTHTLTNLDNQGGVTTQLCCCSLVSDPDMAKEQPSYQNRSQHEYITLLYIICNLLYVIYMYSVICNLLSVTDEIVAAHVLFYIKNLNADIYK